MPAPISIIFPTLNAADRLGPCLGALSEALGEGLIAEVILADCGSTDGTTEAAEAVGARLVASEPGRGTQLRAGAQAACGAWLLFLHSDCVLDEGWALAVRRHMAESPGKAGWFALAFDAEGMAARLVAGWANLRARVFALPYGDQGLLIRRDVYEAAGGFPEIPLMEDVALARALGRRRLCSIGHGITTSAERYQREGWVKRGARNLVTLTRYLVGVDPVRLVRWYRG